jgi:hypothetical protein
VLQKIGIASLLSVAAWLSVGCASETNDYLGNTGDDTSTSTNGGGGSRMVPAAGGGALGTNKAGSGGAAGSNVAGSGGSGGSGGAAGSNVAGSGGGGGSGGAAGSGSIAGSGGAAGSGSVAGSGGSGGSTPKASICDGGATRVLSITNAKVDDFEGATISPSWSSFNDVMPVPNAFSIAQATSDGAANTKKFGHYQGTGAKTLPNMGYGVGTVYNIAIDKAQGKYCIDISTFDGVSFWAKAAKNAANLEVNFVIPETNATKDGGDCKSGCYNHPRKAVTLTTEWQQYTVTFASAGGGAHGITNRIQELAWLAPQDADWDFSIDEIAFYKGSAPTGPVGAAQ